MQSIVLSKSGVSSTDMLRIDKVSSFVRFVDETACEPTNLNYFCDSLREGDFYKNYECSVK